MSGESVRTTTRQDWVTCSILSASTENSNAASLRAFNAYVADHPDVDVVMLPVYDGLTLIRKR